MWRKYRKMKQEIAELKRVAFDYQKDWHRMMNLVKAMDLELEHYQELNQRLMKDLKKRKKK